MAKEYSVVRHLYSFDLHDVDNSLVSAIKGYDLVHVMATNLVKLSG